MSPTISLTAVATQMGMVIGTAAYMAPEQAKGKVVDKRVDVWAFGAVLYEMLTGQRPFVGDDVSDTLAAVLRGEVDLSALSDATPARVRLVLRRCLQKDPKQRLHDVADLRLAMEGAFDMPAPPPVELTETPGFVPQPQVWQRPIPRAILALAIAVIAGVALWTAVRPNVIGADLVRFTIVPPDSARLGTESQAHDLAISRDGTKIVYQGPVAASAVAQALLLRPVDQLEATTVRGTEGGIAPFFSPDGAWLGFADLVGQTLQRVSVFGGPTVTLCLSEQRILGATWSSDKTIIFGTRGAGLFRVAAGGGQPEVLTTLAEGEEGHYWPSMVGGTRSVVFVTGTGAPLITGELALLRIDTGQVTRLGLAGISPRYVETGHLVFGAQDGSIRAVPFDTKRLEITGSPVSLVEGVVVKTLGAADFSISDGGHLVYVESPGGTVGRRTLVWVDRTGREERLEAPPRAYAYPRISPDDLRVSVDINDREDDIWIWNLDRGPLTRVTFSGEAEAYAEWTLKGDRVVFVSQREGPYNLFWKAADGTMEVERLTTSPNVQAPNAISPDGTTVVFRESVLGNGYDLRLLTLDGDPAGEALVATEFNELNAALSQDGRWLAYQSDVSGQTEVYVRPFDVDNGRSTQVASGGGSVPLWAPSGRELYYLGPTSIIAVPIQTAPLRSGYPGAAV